MRIRFSLPALALGIRVCAIATGITSAAAALAQKPALSSELLWLQQEEVIVTNDRAPRRIETIPSNITVITAEQIERSGARQVPDVLRYYAGVDTSDFFGNSRQARVDIRGFGINADASVLVLVDGRRINGVTMFSTDWTTISLERVARIEIVRGGHSVLYGSQAVGGVINIITKRGTIEKQLHAGIDTGSWGYTKPYANFSGTTLLLDGSLTYHLNASRTDSRGYRDNSRLELNTQGVSVNYERGAFSLDASAGHKDDKFGLPGGLSQTANRRSTTYPDDHAITDDSYLHVLPGWRLDTNNRVQVTMDHRKTEGRSFNTFAGMDVTLRDVVKQTAVSPQYIGQQRFGGAKNRVTVGLDHLSSRLNRRGSFSNPDNESTARAVYLLDTLSLLEDAVYVDAGYRKEKFDFNMSEPVARQSVGVHGSKLGLTWNYREGSKAFASFDRSYRVQLLDEIGDPTILKPQVSKQYQIGVSHRFSRATELRAAYFNIRTANEIMLDPLTFANVNWPDTLRKGVEIEANAAVSDSLSTFLSYSQSDATTRSGNFAGKRIPLTPASKGAVGVSFLPANKWTLDAKYRWIRGKLMDGDFQNTAKWKDSYGVADLGLTYRDKRFTVAAGVLNATNQKYSEIGFFSSFSGNSSIYPLPERTFYLNLSITNLF